MRQAIKSFQEKGYGIVKNFLSPQQCDKAIKQINRLIQTYQPKQQTITIFTTKHNKSRKQDYFLQSSDKVRFFLEDDAYKDGKLTVPKIQSINKVGHALHQHNQIFNRITYNKQVGQICNQLKIKNPVVVQSMAILKPPRIGGLVNIHQDSTFLYDDPQTLVGFWVPLQDATVNNGCLWGLPGSHKGKLYHRNIMDWNKKQSYDQVYHKPDYKQSDFVPLQMKKGQLVFFTGRFLHKSHENKSNVSRYAYTWHLKQNESKWASDNWLQRSNFPINAFDQKFQ